MINIKERWIFEASLSLFCVGVFEFFYIWLNRYQIVDYSGFAFDYSFRTFLIQFMQVYSPLFIPLFIFLGLKYRNSLKLNIKKIKILTNFFILCFFSLLTYIFYPSFICEWIFLFSIVFVLVSSRFNLLFAFSFSYLSFYCANMLFEMEGLHFLYSFGTLLSYILIYGIFILVLFKLKIEIDEFVILSSVPILFLWMNYNLINGVYVRLFTFPFFIVVALKIYFNCRNYGKT